MERKKKIRIALVVILSAVFVVAIVGIGVRVDRARTLAVVKKLYSSEVYLNTKKKEALLFAPEALEKLNEKQLVELDEERKAAMVSNLLVVLCGSHDAQPVVTLGSLY